MKKIFAVVGVLLGLVVGTGPVTAAPPPAPRPGPPVLADDKGFFPAATPDGGFCAFQVDYVLTGKSKTIVTPGGRTITSPGQKITLSNGSKSVSYIITGVRREVDTLGPTGDKRIEVTLTGRNIVFNSVDSQRQGLFLLVGDFNYALNNLGGNQFSESRPFSGAGQVTDICEVLA